MSRCASPRSSSLLLGQALSSKRRSVGGEGSDGADGEGEAPAQLPGYMVRVVEEARRRQQRAALSSGAASSDANAQLEATHEASHELGSEEARGGDRKLLAVSTSPSITPAPILSGSVENVWRALLEGKEARCYEHKHCKQGDVVDPFHGIRCWFEETLHHKV